MALETTTQESLSAMFKALGDPTRLGIFQMLRCCSQSGSALTLDEEGQVRPAGSLSVGEVCCQIGGSNSTISHHLKELRLAGLIRMEKRGRWIYCSVNREALDTIRAFAIEKGETSCQPAALQLAATERQDCCPTPSPQLELASTSR